MTDLKKGDSKNSPEIFIGILGERIWEHWLHFDGELLIPVAKESNGPLLGIKSLKQLNFYELSKQIHSGSLPKKASYTKEKLVGESWGKGTE